MQLAYLNQLLQLSPILPNISNFFFFFLFLSFSLFLPFPTLPSILTYPIQRLHQTTKYLNKTINDQPYFTIMPNYPIINLYQPLHYPFPLHILIDLHIRNEWLVIYTFFEYVQSFYKLICLVVRLYIFDQFIKYLQMSEWLMLFLNFFFRHFLLLNLNLIPKSSNGPIQQFFRSSPRLIHPHYFFIVIVVILLCHSILKLSKYS